jgi:hypothetical protein
MKKTVIIFGLISGAVSSVLMAATIPMANRIGFDRAEWLGYTTIVLSMLLVFFGVRSYRENVSEGHITFWKAFVVGLCITLISCALYTATWELLERSAYPDFMDKYAAAEIAKAQASGASAQVVQAKINEMQQMKVIYANPIYNVLMTFIEPFPVGLLITLISAAVLRKKVRTEPAETPAMA